MSETIPVIGSVLLHPEIQKPFSTVTELKGFSSGETLQIKSTSLFDASKELGMNQREMVERLFKKEWADLPEESRLKLQENADSMLRNLEDLSKQGVCTVDGVNYLERYLQAFDGYCKGAEITRTEGAILQTGLTAGCQTLFVQDKTSGDIRMIHTEENLDDLTLRSGGPYDYRVVTMDTGDRKVKFFSYPGLSGWGPAFGTNETTGFFQAVDDQVVRDEYGAGKLWSNAFAFMTLDAGDIHTVERMVENLKNTPDVDFAGGYGIHMAQVGEKPGDKPRMKSVEFADNKIILLEPDEYGDRSVAAQVNLPRDAEMVKLAEYGVPDNLSEWQYMDLQNSIEMWRRARRLTIWGKHENFGKSIDDGIQTCLKILAKPDGDIEVSNDPITGRFRRFPTGLASQWVASHVAGVISGTEMKFVIGKFSPPPIEGREYSINPPKDSPYNRTKLPRLARTTLNQISEGAFDATQYSIRNGKNNVGTLRQKDT